MEDDGSKKIELSIDYDLISSLNAMMRHGLLFSTRFYGKEAKLILAFYSYLKRLGIVKNRSDFLKKALMFFIRFLMENIDMDQYKIYVDKVDEIERKLVRETTDVRNLIKDKQKLMQIYAAKRYLIDKADFREIMKELVTIFDWSKPNKQFIHNSVEVWKDKKADLLRTVETLSLLGFSI